MAADYGRIHRLLKILTLIQGSAGAAGAGWTARRLAQECGTTERTIYRDLRMLEGAGIPYYFDREHNTYAVRKDFFMPPVQLTLEESLALAALAEHVGGKEQVPFTAAAAKAIAKVRGQLPSSIRRELEQIESHVTIKLAASAPGDGFRDVYERVRSALAAKRALRCRYDSISRGGNGDLRSAEEEEFLFEPYALLFQQRAWYAVGHHGGRGGVRCMKLGRFSKLEPTQIPYSVPKSFSLDRHLGNAWRMIRGDRRYAVELRFDPEFSETIADTLWHHTQEVVWHADRSITFRCQVDGLDEILWWILSMGPHCVVRKPKELALRVRNLAEAVVRQYASPK